MTSGNLKWTLSLLSGCFVTWTKPQDKKLNTVKPPNSGHLNSGHAMNSGQNVKSQMWRSFLNYLPIADTSQ